MEKLKDLGNLCIDCKEDTSFGSGKFVNRIPADDGEVSGFMCADCQMVECDSCEQKVYEYSTSEQGWFCEDCYPDNCTDSEFLELALDIMEIPKKDNGEIIEKPSLYFINQLKKLKKMEGEMTKYYGKVTETHEFYIDAHNEKHANRIALEDYIWDEHQTHPNTYDYKIEVEEDNDEQN